MAVRDEIVWRSGIVYIVIILVAVAIISRIAIIQFVQGNKWTEMGESYIYKTESVPGTGAIYWPRTEGYWQAQSRTTIFSWIPGARGWTPPHGLQVLTDCLQGWHG
ncbi:MAG: hypothetical protein R2744_09635 [Bacteroidales bacterium]